MEHTNGIITCFCWSTCLKDNFSKMFASALHLPSLPHIFSPNMQIICRTHTQIKSMRDVKGIVFQRHTSKCDRFNTGNRSLSLQPPINYCTCMLLSTEWRGEMMERDINRLKSSILIIPTLSIWTSALVTSTTSGSKSQMVKILISNNFACLPRIARNNT